MSDIKKDFDITTYNGYSEFFNSWNWEWFVTFTFPLSQSFSIVAINKLRLNWTRSLCLDEHLQVGYVYVLSYASDLPHVHLLMVGSGNKGNRTLSDVDNYVWEEQWPYNAQIEAPYGNWAVAKYVAKNLSWSIKTPDYDFYNIKLLRKLRKTELNSS